MLHKLLSKRTITILLTLLMISSLVACSSESGTLESDLPAETNSNVETPRPSNDSYSKVTPAPNSDGSEAQGTESEDTPSTDESSAGSKILVVYFSRAGENYGVGVIEKGNTHIIADMIAEEMDADTFEIVRVTPYPEVYRDCTDEAQEEKNANARPELTATVENFDDYEIIFLGYPNWWGDMPMPVYTFLESYDFSGKTVAPFCTHGGSGLSRTVQTLTDKLEGATVLDGLAIPGTTAQNEQSKAKESVLSWLDELSIR